MSVCHIEEFKELRPRTAPAPLVSRIVGIQIGLVPDFPISQLQPITVSPPLGIVANDMLADLCPLLIIRRNQCSVFLDLMLDARAQTVKGLGSCRLGGQNIVIGAGKVIGCRIVDIGFKAPKDGVNIDRVLIAVSRVEGCIVISRKGNARRAVFSHIAASSPRIGIGRLGNGAVVYGVHGLYHTRRAGKIDFNLCHGNISFLVCRMVSLYGNPTHLSSIRNQRKINTFFKKLFTTYIDCDKIKSAKQIEYHFTRRMCVFLSKTQMLCFACVFLK